MADAPRKITIKLRPVGAKAAPAAATPAPAAPTPAPAPVPAEEPVEMTPIPETPTAEAAATPAAPAPTPAPELKAEELAQQAKRQTSRIELPPEITKQPMSGDAEAPTIKLKPISDTAQEAPENPQAAKSKTARIELDAVLGGIQTNTPLANTTQKTIKLKRVAPAGSAKPTTSAPMSPIKAPAGASAEAPTIKLQRPAKLNLQKDASAPTATEPELETLEPLEDLDLSPISASPATPVEESAGAKAFTVAAIVAAVASLVATAIVCIVLQKHGASPDGSPVTGNTMHSLPFERLF